MPGEEFILGGENLSMATFLEHLGDVSDKKMPTKTVPYEMGCGHGGGHGVCRRLYYPENPPWASKEGVRLALNQAFVTTHHAEKRLGYRPWVCKTSPKKNLKMV